MYSDPKARKIIGKKNIPICKKIHQKVYQKILQKNRQKICKKKIVKKIVKILAKNLAKNSYNRNKRNEMDMKRSCGKVSKRLTHRSDREEKSLNRYWTNSINYIDRSPSKTSSSIHRLRHMNCDRSRIAEGWNWHTK